MRSRTLAGLALAAALLTAGCSGGSPNGSPDDGAAQPTPSSTASSGDTAEPSTGVGLPANFPTEQVPLADGEIGEVLVNDGAGSYLVKVYPDGDFPTAFAEAGARLVDAGFKQGKDLISAGPTSSTADFTSDDWFVVVTGGMPDRIMLQYTIYPA